MVSKTRRQRQKRKEVLRENGGWLPPAVPCTPVSVHCKKTRPHMKGKKKIRLGLECPTDIYQGFDERGGVAWCCTRCGRSCRTVGFCVHCASDDVGRKHTAYGHVNAASECRERHSTTTKASTKQHSRRSKR